MPCSYGESLTVRLFIENVVYEASAGPMRPIELPERTSIRI